MMNRLSVVVLAAGLLVQLNIAFEQICEPVLPVGAPAAYTGPPVAPLASEFQPFDLAQPLEVVPIAQQSLDGDGHAAVAMAINCLTGKNLRGRDIDESYGYGLLPALREECAEAGYDWKDGGEIGPDKWPLLEEKILQEQTPVVLALNGPEFSPSGRGHIVLVTGIEGEKVTFADPATGTFRSSTRGQINAAPQHPQGNFIFYAKRLDPR